MRIYLNINNLFLEQVMIIPKWCMSEIKLYYLIQIYSHQQHSIMLVLSRFSFNV